MPRIGRCLLLLGLLYSSKALWAANIVPASAQDILYAMGKDAQGLPLQQEDLPDLFTLTASGIESDAHFLVVEKAYTSGRWKGGKAVVRYSRDLSFTQVSVFDKKGVCQRIYAVQVQSAGHSKTAVAPAPHESVFAGDSPLLYAWDDVKKAYVPVQKPGVFVAPLVGKKIDEQGIPPQAVVAEPVVVSGPAPLPVAKASASIVVPEIARYQPTGTIVLHPAPDPGEEWVSLLVKDLSNPKFKGKLSPSATAAPPVKKTEPGPEEWVASAFAEKGVLPVHSLEKFSGPPYGRHQEYERRFVVEKRRSPGVPAHDFYIDEVDRKEKTHHIYYYLHRIGRSPKLVAVEKHVNVSFTKEYELDQEGAGTMTLTK